MNQYEPPAPEKKGLSTGCIVGLVIGGVAFIGLILLGMLLIGIMLPALGKAREAAMQIRHQADARMIALAIESYEQTNGQQPDPANWENLLVTNLLVAPETLEQSIDGAPSTAFFFVPDTVLDASTGAEHEFVVYAHPDTFVDGGVVVRDDGSSEFMANPQFTDLVGRMQNADGSAFAPHAN